MEELEIPFIDPRLELDEATDYTRRPDVHWNNAGHEKIGELLSQCVHAFRDEGDWSNCTYVVMS